MSAVEDDGGARVRVSGDVLMRFADGIRNRRVNEKVYVLINLYITFIQSGKPAEAPAALIDVGVAPVAWRQQSPRPQFT